MLKEEHFAARHWFTRLRNWLRGLQFENELRLHVPQSLNRRCPMCAGSLPHHSFTFLGGEELPVIDAQDADTQLGRLEIASNINAQQWRAVLASTRPRTRPALIAIAFTCPVENEVAILLEVIPYRSTQAWTVWRVQKAEGEALEELKKLLLPLPRVTLS